MKLSEIHEKEKSNNEAFAKWIGDNSQFFNIPLSNQEDLCLYVAGLNREIAVLEADKFRNTWCT